MNQVRRKRGRPVGVRKEVGVHKYLANSKPISDVGACENHWGRPFRVVRINNEHFLEIELSEDEAKPMVDAQRIVRNKW